MRTRIRETAYQTLEKVANIKDKDARRDALREALANNKALSILVQYTFHKDCVFDLPEGPTPESLIRRSGHDDYSILYQSVKKLKNWSVQSPVSRMQKESLWVDLLSAVSIKDAELLDSIKDKKLPWKTLNKLFVIKAVPELFHPSQQHGFTEAELAE